MGFFSRTFRSIFGLPQRSSQTLADAQPGIGANPSTRSGATAAAQLLSLGNAALGQGDLALALEHYSAAVTQDPNNPKAHLNNGFVLLEQGQHAQAEQSLQRALALLPTTPPASTPNELAHEVHYLLARARAAQKDWQGAVQHGLAAVALRSTFAFAWRDLALAQEHLGQFANAVASMTRAVALTPKATQEKLFLGGLLIRDKKPEEALRWVDPILAKQDQESEGVLLAATLVRAGALNALRRFEEALTLLESAAKVYPNDAEVLNSLGNILIELKQHSRALAVYERVLELAPDMAGAWSNSGLALSHLSRDSEALVRFDRAQALAPDQPHVWYNRASVYLKALNCEASIEQSLAGLAINPDDGDLHWNLSTNYLLLGKLAQAWPEFEWRWRAASLAHLFNYPPYPQPRWNGHESLTGKTILLFPEQGLGDVIQFLRYVPIAAERAAQVLLVMPEALQPLLTQLPPNCQLKAPVLVMEECDYQCPLMSLPLAFGTTLETIPNQVPYLHVDSALITHWRNRLGKRTGLRVGLVWSGNALHANDHNRSISLAKMHASLSSLPGCQFISLQLEMRASDCEAFADWPELQHFGNDLKSFADTGALATCMDLVVSVDTSVAHLVGALGVPLWLLLPYVPDWRWMLDRTDTPWYPQARLFRQGEPRQWEPVLQRVMAELSLLVQTKKQPFKT